MTAEPLFECAFSIDELNVLADLLEIPALPGGDPDFKMTEDAKAAAARGLLARGVVVANGPTGSVEISQPYATMISIALFAIEATSYDDGTVAFRSDDVALTVTSLDGGQARWAINQTLVPDSEAHAVATARRGADGITIDSQISDGSVEGGSNER